MINTFLRRKNIFAKILRNISKAKYLTLFNVSKVSNFFSLYFPLVQYEANKINIVKKLLSPTQCEICKANLFKKKNE